MTVSRAYYNGLVFSGMSGGEFGARGLDDRVRRRDRTASVALLHVPDAGRLRRADVAASTSG